MRSHHLRAAVDTGDVFSRAILHLQNPSTNANFSYGTGTWTATVGPNAVFGAAQSPSGASIGTDSNNNSYISFPTNNDAVRNFFGTVSNVTIPLPNACVFVVIEDVSNAPSIFFMEHGNDANNYNGFWLYPRVNSVLKIRTSGSGGGDTGYTYNPQNPAGGTQSLQTSTGTKVGYGFNFTSTSNLTNMFYSSEIGGKRNGVYASGSVITNATTTANLNIGTRHNTTYLLFRGKLYEIFITNVLSASDFDTVIAYFVNKFNL